MSNANKRLAESQALAHDYHLQLRQLTEMLDSMKSENEKYKSMKGKDEDVKRLTSKIRQLETKLMAFNKVCLYTLYTNINKMFPLCYRMISD